MEELDTLFIGSSTRDLLMQVVSPPESDRRITATSFTMTCGGVAATAAVAHQRLGGSVGIISAIGDDESGRAIQEDMASHSFSYIDFKVYPGSNSSTSLIQVEMDGKRCLTCFGGCIDRLTFDQIDQDVLQNTKILHIGVMDFDVASQLCRYMREHTHAKISIDGGNIPLEAAKMLLPYADYYIPDNKTAMATLGMEPEEACRWYVEQGCRFAAVTSAEKGTWAWDGTNAYHADAYPVTLLDTTGAGDNFHGAFLYAVHQGWNPRRCLRFANIFASLTCEGMGGHAAIPSLQKVLDLLDV